MRMDTRILGSAPRASSSSVNSSSCGAIGASAALLVLLVGAVLGAHRLSGEVTEPLLVGLYSIPKITLYPVVLLLFGLGMSAKIAFGAMHGIIPVILFTMNAVRNIPHVYMRAGRSMRWRAC